MPKSGEPESSTNVKRVSLASIHFPNQKNHGKDFIVFGLLFQAF